MLKRRAHNFLDVVVTMYGHPIRCSWAKGENYIRYHDEEWGVPVHDDRTLFEFLILEGAQAGLSWSTILNKRENYREPSTALIPSASPNTIARNVKSLLSDAGIVRNKLKIASAVQNAKRSCGCRRSSTLSIATYGNLSDGQPKVNPWKVRKVPARNARIRCHEQGSETPRVQLHGLHHLLRLHASSRHGQ